VYAEGSAAPCLGVSGALGEQAHRCSRSGGALSGADESTERARLADMARLSVAHGGSGALRLHGYGSKIFEAIQYHRISKRDTNSTNPHEFGYEFPGTEQVGRVTPCAPFVNRATEPASRGLPALPQSSQGRRPVIRTINPRPILRSLA